MPAPSLASRRTQRSLLLRACEARLPVTIDSGSGARSARFALLDGDTLWVRLDPVPAVPDDEIRASFSLGEDAYTFRTRLAPDAAPTPAAPGCVALRVPIRVQSSAADRTAAVDVPPAVESCVSLSSADTPGASLACRLVRVLDGAFVGLIRSSAIAGQPRGTCYWARFDRRTAGDIEDVAVRLAHARPISGSEWSAVGLTCVGGDDGVRPRRALRAFCEGLRSRDSALSPAPA